VKQKVPVNVTNNQNHKRNIMKCNAWTLALIGAGLVSVPAVTHADESTNAVPTLLTSLASTTLSGYVDTSAHWNPNTGNANLPVYSPNGRQGGEKADGFNFNLLNLTLSHPAGDGWSAGYNASVLIGPDAVGYNNFSGSGDVSLKDAYVDLHVPIGNTLDVKLGTYSEPLGYEVYETGNNPNYTRSYGYEVEPTALTGVLFTYPLFSSFSASFGIANTWSAGINARAFPAKAESHKTYIGYLSWTAPTNTGFLSGSIASAGIINGYDALNQVDKTSYYIGATINTPINNLKVGAAFDYVTLAENNLALDPTTALPAVPGPDAGYQEVLGLYASFQATEKLSLYARGEMIRQSGYLGFPANGNGFSGNPADAYELTGTLQYDLWKNVLSRLEFRWDHAEHGHPYGGEPGTIDPAGPTVINGGAAKDEFLLAINLIYKF
jgi:hypothetical protein